MYHPRPDALHGTAGVGPDLHRFMQGSGPNPVYLRAWILRAVPFMETADCRSGQGWLVIDPPTSADGGGVRQRILIQHSK